MNIIADIVDLYLFNLPETKEELHNTKLLLVNSSIVFIFSLLSRSIGYSLVIEESFYSFLILLITQLFFTIVGIFIFTIWTGFVASVSKKNWFLSQFLAIMFVAHSPFFLLLPVSLICYYANFTSLYFLIEFILMLNVISRILKYTKIYFDFNKNQIFLLITLPILIVLVLISLPVLFLILFFYGII
ncbi:MAG: hypothetical protein N2Z73_01540 [Endomicrobia bacterium]|nr:hypothetical protein [Endomicrobiia bacterium]